LAAKFIEFMVLIWHFVVDWEMKNSS